MSATDLILVIDNFGIILEIIDGYRNTVSYHILALFWYPGINKDTSDTYLCACSKSNLISPWSIVILIKFTININTSLPVFVVSEINLFVPDRNNQLGLAAPSIKTFFFNANRQITTKRDCKGSLGFNEEILQSLLGNIGRQDVDDVHLSLIAVVEKECIVTTNIHCFGGSHGGFISAHLIGQYKVCILELTYQNGIDVDL
ncbi:hypothetical protein MXB_3608 [Myxobolus squamalis]|nr:hypothetical protein MXB_3608 [Myxobolus squamalis]